MKKYLVSSLFTLAFVLSAHGVNAAPTTSGLVGYWKFDEKSGTTAVDSSATNANGSVIGSVWTIGAFSNALSFDGANDYVKIPHKSVLNPKGNTWTVSAWIKTSASNGTVLHKGDSDPDEYQLSIVNGTAQFNINAGGTTVLATAKSTTLVTDGLWHHIVGVRTGNNSVSIYVDGIQEGTASYSGSGTSIDTSNALTIGAQNGGSDAFAGIIDEVRIYNRSLSTAEIGELGSGISSPTADTVPPTLSGGLPTGILAYNTTNTILSVVTNENAVCRYSQTAGTTYSSMTSTFSVTGSTIHTQSVTGLTNGSMRTYYVRCVDMSSNANTGDYVITFSVSSVSGTVPLPTVPDVCPSYPASILNLTNWKETLPTGSAGSPTEIKQPTLATYTNDPYFKINTTCNGVQFRAPVNGVTTSGSSYPRSELREMTSSGTANASWSTTAGTHTMIIDQAITAVPKTKKHVVAGQIHDSADDVIVIRLEYPKLFIDINGTDGPVLDPSYTLGKRFTVKFVASGGQIKIYYNGNTSPAYTLSKSGSGMYFKAGAYTQSNCTRELATDCVSSNYGEVNIYNVTVSHTTGSVTDTTAPSIPTSLIAVPVSSSGINLSWVASVDNVSVAGYKVYRNGIQIATVTSGTTYADTGLTPLTTYAYTVSAYDAESNSSAQSAPILVTTLADTASVVLSGNAQMLITLVPVPSDARVYYTTNNTIPSELSNLYTAPFKVPIGTPIKTRAYKDGYAMSQVLEFIDGVLVLSSITTPTATVSTTKYQTVASNLSVYGTVSTTEYLKVRATPTLSGEALGTQSVNAGGVIVDGPISADGYTWWKIDYATGPDGWSAGTYLRKI